MTGREYHVKVHFEDDSYWAEIEELPGCFAAGDTLDELVASLPEVVGLYLSSPGHPVQVQVDEVRTEREFDDEQELLLTTC